MLLVTAGVSFAQVGKGCTWWACVCGREGGREGGAVPMGGGWMEWEGGYGGEMEVLRG